MNDEDFPQSCNNFYFCHETLGRGWILVYDIEWVNTNCPYHGHHKQPIIPEFDALSRIMNENPQITSFRYNAHEKSWTALLPN